MTTVAISISPAFQNRSKIEFWLKKKKILENSSFRDFAFKFAAQFASLKRSPPLS